MSGSATLYFTIGDVSWTVERRRDVEPLPFLPPSPRGILYLYFQGPDGELRRSEIAEDFPLDPPAYLLHAVWRSAEIIRAGDPGEMTSHSGMTVPRMRDTLRLMARALILHCPNCGGGPVLRDWFHLRDRCPTCGIRLERGEESDYYLGGMMFNIVLAEGLFAIAFVVTLVVMWPDVPWDALQYLLVAAMIIAPILLYPVSRVIWLAFDLLLRPPTPEEMAWYARTKDPDAPSPPPSPPTAPPSA